MAAGFDKNGEAMESLFQMGFGFVEIGSVCPRPQPGNSKPRVFRLKEDKAIINRYGFNSDGATEVGNRLKKWRERASKNVPERPHGILGVNLGKNKSTPNEESADDYVIGTKNLGTYADYLVINVSSPNTPQLRALQTRKELSNILTHVLNTRDHFASASSSESLSPTGKRKTSTPPILVKISPDLTQEEKKEIAKVALEFGVDGIIVSNTTINRSHQLLNDNAKETGGLSGKPLFDPSTRVLKDMYELTEGKIVLIGVGGISTGRDAYEKIKAGASLVQLYTALTYEGPALIPSIKKELAELIKEDGHSTISDAIGINCNIKEKSN